MRLIKFVVVVFVILWGSDTLLTGTGTKMSV